MASKVNRFVSFFYTSVGVTPLTSVFQSPYQPLSIWNEYRLPARPSSNAFGTLSTSLMYLLRASKMFLFSLEFIIKYSFFSYLFQPIIIPVLPFFFFFFFSKIFFCLFFLKDFF